MSPQETNPSGPPAPRHVEAGSQPMVPASPPKAAGLAARAQTPSAPDVASLLRALRRRLGLVLGGGLLCAAAAAALVWFVVPQAKYTAVSTLRVEMHRPKVLFQTAEVEADYRTFQNTQMKLLTSRKVLNAVLQDPRVAGLETIREVSSRQQDPLEWLEGTVQVAFPGNSEILQVAMSDTRPSDLATLVNVVVETYMELVVREEKTRREARVDNLKKLWDTYQDNLRSKRDDVRTLALTAGSDDRTTLALKSRFTIEHLALAEQEQIRNVQDLSRAQAEVAVLRRAIAAADAAPPAPPSDRKVDAAVDRDPRVHAQGAAIEALDRRLDGVRRLARRPDDPAIRAVALELDAARRNLDELRGRVRNELLEHSRDGLRDEQREALSRLEDRITVLTQFDEGLQGDVERLREEVAAFNANVLDLQAQQDEIALISDTARRIGTEVEAMGVEFQAPERIRVIDPAAVPRTKDEMKRIKVTGTAAAGAFASVLCLVTFWEFRARRVGSVDEVVHGLGLRLVGALPALPAPGGRLGLRAERARRDSQGLMVESVDAIRTMLLHASRDGSLQVVLVTSALPGEGKTSLSGHLAASLARSGRRTLLVDCDLRRPTTHRLFDLPLGPGLCEVLRGDIGVDDAIYPVGDGELSVLPAGQINARSTQALARGDLQSIIDGLKGRSDFIIVDSAPILPVADTLQVAQHVDAVLFSILRDVSQVPMVQEAYNRLEALGVRILGAVVAGAVVGTYDAHYRYREASQA